MELSRLSAARITESLGTERAKKDEIEWSRTHLLDGLTVESRPRPPPSHHYHRSEWEPPTQERQAGERSRQPEQERPPEQGQQRVLKESLG